MANLRVGRRSGLVLRGGRQRRETIWIGQAQVIATITGTGTSLLTSLTAAGLALRPFTVVRDRVHVSMQSDQVIATEDQLCYWGKCVVSDQASAIGVSAVPTPLTDLGSDLWYAHAVLQGSFLFGDATGQSQFIADRREVDSRAMRKVEDGSDLIQVIEAGGAGISDGFTLTSVGRTLIKLH